MKTNLHRIAVIGTKRPNRRYVTDTNGEVAITADRREALHWNRREAMILTSAFNAEFAQLGRTERFQIEKSA